MSEYPVGKECPSCGSRAFERVQPEEGRVTFVADRVCTNCGQRYTVPTPRWAGALFLASGLAALGFGVWVVSEALREAVAGNALSWLMIVKGPLICAVGFAILAHGWRSLTRGPASFEDRN